MINKLLKTAAIVSVGLVPTLSAHADGYPAKPVRIIVPYNAGGAVDYVGRVTAQELGKKLGQNFVVENRPGASAGIGIQFVKNARPDGYTLLFTSITSNAITAAMEPDTVGYDLKIDLQPAGIVGRVPLVLAASQNVEANSIAEFIEFAKAQDRPLSFASSGIGSTEHLGALAFSQAANVELQHIPYTGGAPAMTDVAAGRVDLMVATLPTAQPQIEAGSIKALVIAGDSTIDVLPNVPTAKEVSLEGFNIASVYGLLAPKEIGAEALSTLRKALDEITRSPEFGKLMLDRGIIPNTQPESELEASYSAELELWRKLVSQIESN